MYVFKTLIAQTKCCVWLHIYLYILVIYNIRMAKLPIIIHRYFTNLFMYEYIQFK